MNELDLILQGKKSLVSGITNDLAMLTGGAKAYHNFARHSPLQVTYHSKINL